MNVPDNYLTKIDFSQVTFHDLFNKKSATEIRACLNECGPTMDDKHVNKVFNGFQCLRQMSKSESDSAQNMANSSTNNSISQSVSSNSSSTSSVLTGQAPTCGKQADETTGSNSSRVKQQRKSESDVHFNSVNSSNCQKQLKPLTNNQYSTSSNNCSNLSSSSTSSNCSNKNAKSNFTFSPILPIKTKSKFGFFFEMIIDT